MTPLPFGPYNRVTVLEVHDGDTLTVVVDLGFSISVTEQIRIYGINAPELSKGTPEDRAKGIAARDFLRSMLPVGTAVGLRTTPAQTRTFTRYVGTITRGGMDVAGAMVAAGQAIWCDANLRPLPGPPPPIG
jgi:micrococcal nuclease